MRAPERGYHHRVAGKRYRRGGRAAVRLPVFVREKGEHKGRFVKGKPFACRVLTFAEGQPDRELPLALLHVGRIAVLRQALPVSNGMHGVARTAQKRQPDGSALA